MPLPPTTLARLAKLVDSAITPRHAERVRRIEQATNTDGTVRGEQIAGLIPARARWPIEPEQVAVPGFDYDTLQDLLDDLNAAVGGLGTTYLPIASPTFTGTLTGPTVTTGALTVTGTTDLGGDNAIGNQAADVALIWGHLRHKSPAPTIAVGAALGTGGSVGATIIGSDQAMQVSLTAGTTSLVAGTAATITFNVARPNTNHADTLTPANAAARINAVQAGLNAPHTTGTIIIAFSVAPTSGTAYSYDITVKEFTN
jgi:hypothetical protein